MISDCMDYSPSQYLRVSSGRIFAGSSKNVQLCTFESNLLATW